MTATKVIVLARKNIGGEMESSARLCLQDAIELHAQGNYEFAKARALKSLAYSVGVFHADYQKAAR